MCGCCCCCLGAMRCEAFGPSSSLPSHAFTCWCAAKCCASRPCLTRSTRPSRNLRLHRLIAAGRGSNARSDRALIGLAVATRRDATPPSGWVRCASAHANACYLETAARVTCVTDLRSLAHQDAAPVIDMSSAERQGAVHARCIVRIVYIARRLTLGPR